MRESARSAFVAFTSPLEGVVRWMYLDVKGLVTCAIGNLVDPVQMALPLPWVHGDGSPASRAEIAAEWMRVKADPVAARRGHRYTEGITNLRLTPEGIDLVVSRKLSQMDQYLASRFGDDWEDWNACAQLATLSMSWACGPAFRFPALEQALRARDFDAAAIHCTIQEAGNPGVVPRNRANRVLYRNAARIDAFKLDPSLINYDAVLGVQDADTQPDITLPSSIPPPMPNIGAMLAEYDEEPSSPATSPTIHVLRYDRGPDDPPDEAG